MLILPAIDLFEGKAVRLLRGDYARMTVYSDSPADVGRDFARQGAEWAHLVDLEGAKTGETPNLETVLKIKRESGLKCEVGGGIRSLEVIARCLDAGLDRVILGTAAVQEQGLAEEAVRRYGDKIAVGVDIFTAPGAGLREGRVAVKGWTEDSGLEAFGFCRKMQQAGVRTLICTDISRDGAMKGTNVGLCRELQEQFDMRVIASGGVSSLEDVRQLAALRLYGAIIGKAYYTGAVSLREAVEAAR
ncbi:MAG: 1-(5-phosphoribosyl)-5-[(5-phosphoribosylamino)methylideneamino]imidazole-4-carboxamide isomerase [Fretibacterium sp.]|nr:1-(5-phosphoribosyl)-5-[(5-phosphoribosylamino)methylideneamino]imidazole-4-carboxamide isomerase [Fretibacterium sp.]